METSNLMANELENMIENGEVDSEVISGVRGIISDLREGEINISEYYQASTPHKLLEVLDVVSERVKR